MAVLLVSDRRDPVGDALPLAERPAALLDECGAVERFGYAPRLTRFLDLRMNDR